MGLRDKRYCVYRMTVYSRDKKRGEEEAHTYCFPFKAGIDDEDIELHIQDIQRQVWEHTTGDGREWIELAQSLKCIDLADIIEADDYDELPFTLYDHQELPRPDGKPHTRPAYFAQQLHLEEGLYTESDEW